MTRCAVATPYGFLCLRQTWQTLEVRDYALLKLLNSKVPLTASLAKTATPPYWYLTPNKNEVAAHLAAQCVRAGMKVLLFLQNTGHVNSIAGQIDKLIGSETEETELTDHEKLLLETAREEMGTADAVLSPMSQTGSHHGLMLPVERELAELQFRRRDGIHALAATATLAQGMNLPADIVFIVGEERFDSGTNKFERLEAHELLNAAGRAGRAGHVSQGMVVVLPHSLVDFNATSNKISTRWKKLQEAVFSQADQCLVIEDPIQNIIDRIQNNIEESLSDPDVKYFIRRLREALLRSCFSDQARAMLEEQAGINAEAFSYSIELEHKAHLPLVQETLNADAYKAAVRDQGFRRIVVSTYDHRCALCGVRIITAEGHTVVDAAHIIPWSRSRNDDLRNGMALCKICHWAFDEGMMGVSEGYVVITSRQIAANPNVPGFLLTLTGRSIIPPPDRDLWPAQQYLAEHRKEWRL